MPWMLEKRNFDGPRKLKELLKRDSILKMPGAHNALVGMLAKKIGFEALYVSGAAFSASKGLPDLGYYTVTELSDYVHNLYSATGLPILVDVDTGFGEVLNLARTVKEMEDAGAAAIQMEDQLLPKKCGHLDGKRLVSAEDMCRKIEAAVKVRKNLLIMARTDAHSLHGIDEAIRRAKMYVEAGADMIFPEALKTEEDFKQFAQEVKVPLLANMTEFGKTPYWPASQFEQWGYKIIIYPVTSLRIAMKAVEKVFREIYETGSQEKLVSEMQTRKELYELLDYYGYEEFDKTVAESKHQDFNK
ncbi:MAG: methylisocitrate lyase [Candidatus Hydrogenedentota bacterium]|nr:MAG: methylisocitrate lyase [Candidatus Hydrogenedentota bacterium]